MERIDRKFSFGGVCTEHEGAHEVTHENAVVFLARDKALIPTLHFYMTRCHQLGADLRQIEGVRLLIERVERWQEEHPEAVKVADVEVGPEGDPIVARNEGWPNLPGVPS
jgi:hypothetical protein